MRTSAEEHATIQKQSDLNIAFPVGEGVRTAKVLTDEARVIVCDMAGTKWYCIF
jgi:hypothetical protein